MDPNPIQRWHDTVNLADLEGVRDVITDPVVVSGPQGAGTITAGEFAEWVIRSGIRLQPVSWHVAGERIVVVEQEATWPESEEPRTVATMFRLTGNRVSAALRFPDLEQALAFARPYVQLAATEGE
ncbi:MAG TPA: hypothetical protein VK689_03005 [Armatimonadota bacterium]|nr:hypothetical protein [Armatimonadota bacterium]